MISNDDRALHISHDTLRLGIGVLGLTMPLLLILGAWGLQTSISDYYYTNMRDYFEGVMFFLAFFLSAYRPYGQDGWRDNWITNLAAFCALLLALFPTNNVSLGHLAQNLVLKFVNPELSGLLHNCGAGGLFTCFAVLSLFFFTKGKKDERTTRKSIRNAIYIVCGLGIAAGIGFIGVSTTLAPGQTGRDLLNILVPESLSLVLFGFSWLVKGSAFPFLNDKPSQSEAMSTSDNPR